MQTAAISAPGKLFLIGEYAVLEGAPALLTAVDRRVRVAITPAADGRWCLSAPNLGIHDLALDADGGLPAALGANTRARLAVFDAVRATVAENIGLPGAAPRLVIDSADFARDDGKLGLGSSAAVAAALTQALLLCCGHPSTSRARRADLAIAAHRRAQHGAGSGGDVAACVYGGTIRYVVGEKPARLAWPETLTGMAVVTGGGAATTGLVARVKSFGARDPRRYAADIERLAGLAEYAPVALARGDDFLALAASYHRALDTLDAHAQAGIVTARHRELHELAARHGAVFKTSGAGGGDAGLLFARAGAHAERVARCFNDAGAPVLPLAFAAPGLRVDA